MNTNSRKIEKKPLVICVLIVIIFSLLGGAGMFGLAKHRQNTYYVAQRSVVISHRIQRNEDTNNQDSETSPDISMMPTYKNIAEDPIVAKKARTYLPSKLRHKYSAYDISQLIDTHTSQLSLVLNIKVKTQNKNNSIKVVNAVSRAFKQELPKVQPGAGTVKLLSPATKESVLLVRTPHVKKYVALGLAVGFLLGLIISFLYITWVKLL